MIPLSAAQQIAAQLDVAKSRHTVVSVDDSDLGRVRLYRPPDEDDTTLWCGCLVGIAGEMIHLPDPPIQTVFGKQPRWVRNEVFILPHPVKRIYPVGYPHVQEHPKSTTPVSTLPAVQRLCMLPLDAWYSSPRDGMCIKMFHYPIN